MIDSLNRFFEIFMKITRQFIYSMQGQNGTQIGNAKNPFSS